MSWAPTDLLADDDLLAYEPKILSQFGQIQWAPLRAKVLEDWLWPQLEAASFPAPRFRTRFAPDAVLIDAAGTFSDVTSAAQDATVDDLALATAFASTATRLCVGSAVPFRGLSCRMGETVNATTAKVTVALWRDGWQSVAVADNTSVGGAAFARGGAITWTVPETWVPRTLSDTTPRYWARVTLSVAPNAGTLGQVAVIRRSRLCGAVTCRTLAAIFRAAPLSQDGPWREKADWYEAEAERMLQRALPLLGGEFDTVTEDDVVDADEAGQTADEARATVGWTFERA